ncbi:MAG TPA: hypothetical protein VGJ05_12940 [Fimbriiglobus sp.]|jgi:hypothetical protein
MSRFHVRPMTGATPSVRRAELEQHLAKLAAIGPEAINARLDELAYEWSTGRLTKAVAGLIVLAGLVLAATVSPWFAALSALGGVMLAWYAVGRRSWIAALFSAAGFRSGTEIHEEMMALKALRGDFRHLPTVHEIEDKDAIARLEGEGGIVFEPEDAKVDTKDAVRDVVSAARIESSEVAGV